MKEPGRQPRRNKLQEFLASHPYILMVGAILVALVMTLAMRESPGALSAWGFGATMAAFVLALLIYAVTAEDTSRLLERIDSLEQQIADSTDEPTTPAQTWDEVDASIEQYREYIDALMLDYPMPERAIVRVERPGGGKGNRPVIVETKRGRRYSVWKGGRRGGFTVTKLPPTSA